MHPSAASGGRAVEPGSWSAMTDRSRPGAALILAAGEGTRMRSAVPKVLHPIGGRSLLGHAVHAVAELDPEQLVVVARARRRPGAGGRHRARRRAGPPGHRRRAGAAAGHRPRGAVRARRAARRHHRPRARHLRRRAAAVRRHARHAAWPSTPRPGRRSRWSPPSSPTPPATAAWCARRDGTVTRIVEQADATRGGAGDPRGQLRRVRVRRRVPRPTGLGRLSTANNQGELYLTDLIKIAHDDGARRCAA